MHLHLHPVSRTSCTCAYTLRRAHMQGYPAGLHPQQPSSVTGGGGGARQLAARRARLFQPACQVDSLSPLSLLKPYQEADDADEAASQPEEHGGVTHGLGGALNPGLKASHEGTEEHGGVTLGLGGALDPGLKASHEGTEGDCGWQPAAGTLHVSQEAMQLAGLVQVLQGPLTHPDTFCDVVRHVSLCYSHLPEGSFKDDAAQHMQLWRAVERLLYAATAGSRQQIPTADTWVQLLACMAAAGNYRSWIPARFLCKQLAKGEVALTPSDATVLLNHLLDLGEYNQEAYQHLLAAAEPPPAGCSCQQLAMYRSQCLHAFVIDGHTSPWLERPEQLNFLLNTRFKTLKVGGGFIKTGIRFADINWLFWTPAAAAAAAGLHNQESQKPSDPAIPPISTITSGNAMLSRTPPTTSDELVSVQVRMVSRMLDFATGLAQQEPISQRRGAMQLAILSAHLSLVLAHPPRPLPVALEQALHDLVTRTRVLLGQYSGFAELVSSLHSNNTLLWLLEPSGCDSPLLPPQHREAAASVLMARLLSLRPEQAVRFLAYLCNEAGSVGLASMRGRAGLGRPPDPAWQGLTAVAAHVRGDLNAIKLPEHRRQARRLLELVDLSCMDPLQLPPDRLLNALDGAGQREGFVFRSVDEGGRTWAIPHVELAKAVEVRAEDLVRELNPATLVDKLVICYEQARGKLRPHGLGGAKRNVSASHVAYRRALLVVADVALGLSPPQGVLRLLAGLLTLHPELLPYVACPHSGSRRLLRLLLGRYLQPRQADMDMALQLKVVEALLAGHAPAPPSLSSTAPDAGTAAAAAATAAAAAACKMIPPHAPTDPYCHTFLKAFSCQVLQAHRTQDDRWAHLARHPGGGCWLERLAVLYACMPRHVNIQIFS